MSQRTMTLAALFVVAASAVHAQTYYSGADDGVGPGGAHPFSDAASALFNTAAAAGQVSTINFESAPVTSFTSLLVAPGVTVSGADYQGNPLAILNAPSNPPTPAIAGFNTTPGGSQYLFLQGGTATFTFSTPVSGFGAYFTGIQPSFFQDTVTFDDGTIKTASIPSITPSDGGVSFLGFTDPGKTFTSVTINAGTGGTGADFIGIDDVSIVSTPEPGTLGLIAGLGVSGSVFALRRRLRKV